MKLSQYAKKHSITYRTAWNHWKTGKVSGTQLPTGTIIVDCVDHNRNIKNVACIYTRVSSSENKKNLDSQAERLCNYAIARGYKIQHIIKEIGSGINDNRSKLNKILVQYDYDTIIVEHKDRLTRFGFNYLEILLKECGKKIEVVNNADDGKDDLMQDFVSIITSFCARIYGLRRSKRRTESIIKELQNV